MTAELNNDDELFGGLFSAVRERGREADSLVLKFKWLQEQFALLDAAPRHDTSLDDETLVQVYKFSLDAYGPAFDRATRDILLAHKLLSGALSALDGVFRGELKVRLEDKLAQQAQDVSDLAQRFENAVDEFRYPRKPHLIRQQSLSGLLKFLAPFIEELKTTRTAYDALAVGEIHPRLLSIESRLLKIRSQIAKCRDNPSQKMAAKAAQWTLELEGICRDIEAIKSKSKYECLRAGGQFFGRSGEITSQWSPEMASLDPWTFPTSSL